MMYESRLIGGHLYEYQDEVEISGVRGKLRLTFYCIPIGVTRLDNGRISGYKVLRVFEVEEYLKGNHPSSSIEVVYKPVDVPQSIKRLFDSMDFTSL